MTKWKRLRKLREKKRFEAEALRPKAEGEEVKQTEPEKISENIQQSQEIEKLITLKIPSQQQFLLKFLDTLTC